MRTIFTIAAFIVLIGVIVGGGYGAINFLLVGIDWLKEHKKYNDKGYRKECISQAIAAFAICVFFIAATVMFATSYFL